MVCRVSHKFILEPPEITPEAFEQELLAVSPEARRPLMARFSGFVQEPLVEALAARARAASAVSPAESLRLAGIVGEMAEVVGSARAHACASWARGAALRSLARFDEALEAFLTGAQCAEQANDTLLAARIPMAAPETLAQLGRYDEALRLSSDLETRFHALGAPDDAAKVVANAGNIHFQREDYAEALAHWERALAFFEERGEQVRAARLRMNVGNALCCLYRLSEAVRMYESAREILESAGMDLLAAGLDGDLGFLRFMAGQHNESLQAYTRARNRFEALELPMDVAQCDREAAEVYLDLNLIPEAREMYERALPALRAHQMTAEAARGESGLAATLFRQGDTDEAFSALERAERAFAEEGNTVGVARVQMRRAAFQPQDAEDSVQTALRTFRRQGLMVEALLARLIHAEMRVAQGGSPVRPLRELAAEADREGLSALRWRIEAARARAARNAGQHSSALRHYRRGVDAVEEARLVLQGNEFRIAFLQDKIRLYEELLDLLLDRSGHEAVREAFTVFEQAKSRTLLEAMTAPSRPDTADAPERQALLQRLDSLRARLNWRYVRTERPDAGEGRIPSAGQTEPEDARALEREYQEAYRQLEILSRGEASSSEVRAPRVEDIQALLSAEEQIVAYTTVRDEILAFIIDRDGLHVRRNLASRAEVERLTERLRFQWHKMEMRAYAPVPGIAPPDGTDRILKQLYTLLVEPLQDLLPGAQLTVVPHGVLHTVPFHALHDGLQYLIDRWEIAYAPGCSVWAACRERKEIHGERSLVFGLSEAGIIHTQEEAENLRCLLPGVEVFTEQAATVDAVPKSGVFQHLHFATHAVFRKDNPLFSALRLADGWLFAHDLYRRRLDCSLVTLSACHTGTGAIAPGDEVLGLVHGFLYAGARAVLVSLWAADDAATATLMRECYTGMAAGLNRAAALRAAQRTVREQWPHPYYWAAFTLVGAR
jgi:CHAT domain-containing protein